MKAYDSVLWDYLDSKFEQKGFGSRWCNWIHGCLQLGTSSVLVNGCPTKEYRLYRGLRQGDLISPFLFTLIMEGLNDAIKKWWRMGRIKVWLWEKTI